VLGESALVPRIDSCAPAHLKLVRFPARSPLPFAALPSMSLFPKAPFNASVSRLSPARPVAPFARCLKQRKSTKEN